MASAHPDAELLAAAREGRFADAAALAQALAAVDPFAIAGDEARLAFWINLYNARVLHEFGERPRQGSLVRHQRVFRRIGCRVGEHVYSLNAIPSTAPRHPVRRCGATGRRMRTESFATRPALTSRPR